MLWKFLPVVDNLAMAGRAIQADWPFVWPHNQFGATLLVGKLSRSVGWWNTHTHTFCWLTRLYARKHFWIGIGIYCDSIRSGAPCDAYRAHTSCHVDMNHHLQSANLGLCLRALYPSCESPSHHCPWEASSLGCSKPFIGWLVLIHHHVIVQDTEVQASRATDAHMHTRMLVLYLNTTCVSNCACIHLICYIHVDIYTHFVVCMCIYIPSVYILIYIYSFIYRYISIYIYIFFSCIFTVYGYIYMSSALGGGSPVRVDAPPGEGATGGDCDLGIGWLVG